MPTALINPTDQSGYQIFISKQRVELSQASYSESRRVQIHDAASRPCFVLLIKTLLQGALSPNQAWEILLVQAADTPQEQGNYLKNQIPKHFLGVFFPVCLLIAKPFTTYTLNKMLLTDSLR